MDVLVEAALDAVINYIEAIKQCEGMPGTRQQELIAKAVHAVDALKSALKAL